MWFPVLLAVLVLPVSDGGKCDVNAIKVVVLISAVQGVAIFQLWGPFNLLFSGYGRIFPCGLKLITHIYVVLTCVWRVQGQLLDLISFKFVFLRDKLNTI
jgi:hypothetical protein